MVAGAKYVSAGAARNGCFGTDINGYFYYCICFFSWQKWNRLRHDNDAVGQLNRNIHSFISFIGRQKTLRKEQCNFDSSFDIAWIASPTFYNSLLLYIFHHYFIWAFIWFLFLWWLSGCLVLYFGRVCVFLSDGLCFYDIKISYKIKNYASPTKAYHRIVKDKKDKKNVMIYPRDKRLRRMECNPFPPMPRQWTGTHKTKCRLF